jgi:Fatty acid hydroxylase superfamily
MDGWQYFWHRAFHESRFLYRNFHSHHHRLYVPYAFGALYNHPLEGEPGGALLAEARKLTDPNLDSSQDSCSTRWEQRWRTRWR